MKRKLLSASLGLLLLAPIVTADFSTTKQATIETQSISNYDTAGDQTVAEITPIDTFETDYIVISYYNEDGVEVTETVDGSTDDLIVGDTSYYTFHYRYTANATTEVIGWNLYEVTSEGSTIKYTQVQTGTLTPTNTDGTVDNTFTINNMTGTDYYLTYTFDGISYTEDSIYYYNNKGDGDNLIDNWMYHGDAPYTWTWPGWLTGVIVGAGALLLIGIGSVGWMYWNKAKK